MTVRINKEAINLREKLSELDKPSGLVGEELLRADTSADAREALNLEEHLFEDFESTGIDDNATSTKVTVSDSGVDVTGTVTADGLTVDGATTINQASDTNSYLTLDGASGAYLSLAATTGHISADSTLTLNTASSERMRIDSSGKVGIGTSSPVEKLYVNSTSGDARIGLNAPTGSDTEIKFSNNGTVEYSIGHDDATDNFVIGTTNVDSGLVSVTKSGNVGIGDADTSGYKLHVKNSNSNSLRLTNSSGPGCTLHFVDNAWQSQIQGNAGSLLFKTGGANEVARIDWSGNLLVGTTVSEGAEFKINGGTRYDYLQGAASSINAWIGTDESGAGSESSIVVGRGTYSTGGNERASIKLAPAHGNDGYNGGFAIGAEKTPSGTTHATLEFRRLTRNNASLDDTSVASLDRNGNLNLSGSIIASDGIFLGGTGSANKLDDYETGTFTPTVFGAAAAGTGTYTHQSGRYTKVGNKVFVEIVLSWTAHTGTGALRIDGLPFNTDGTRQSFNITAESLTYTGEVKVLSSSGSSNDLWLFNQGSNTGLTIVSMDTNVSYMVITGSYTTNS